MAMSQKNGSVSRMVPSRKFEFSVNFVPNVKRIRVKPGDELYILDASGDEICHVAATPDNVILAVSGSHPGRVRTD